MITEWQYDGPIISLNDYRRDSWPVLARKINGVKDYFGLLLNLNKPQRCQSYHLVIKHNTRLDLDNVIGMVKPIVDTLRRRGFVPDDDKRYWKKLTLEVDDSVEKGCLKIQLISNTL